MASSSPTTPILRRHSPRLTAVTGGDDPRLSSPTASLSRPPRAPENNPKLPFSGHAVLDGQPDLKLSFSGQSVVPTIKMSGNDSAIVKMGFSGEVAVTEEVMRRIMSGEVRLGGYEMRKLEDVNGSTEFVGEAVPEEEARRRWPRHYENQGKKMKSRGSNNDVDDDDDELMLDVKCHYLSANISGCIINIGDCAYVKGEEGKPNYVARILEFFETKQGENFCTVQWFYRAEETVMQEQGALHDKKRLFESDLRNDNLLDCIISKVRVVQLPASVDSKSRSNPSYDFYYDMRYANEYCTFCTLETDVSEEKSDISSSNRSIRKSGSEILKKRSVKKEQSDSMKKVEAALLDLYSGCGGMSTGLCSGAQAAGVNLVTRWAVDFSETACQSIKRNHPGTQVRNESADDFFDLLKEWERLCKQYDVIGSKKGHSGPKISSKNDFEGETEDADNPQSGEYEILKLVDICYGDPSDTGKRGLKFKVRWKGYSASEDTWEPIEELSKCEDGIEDFVVQGFKLKILPLPGDVDVVCGGPPCQGISGYNRFRNSEAPLEDERNKQIIVYMDIVQFLKPKYVLMENVCDILRFADGILARYAISRLVSMSYQSRLGIMAAGCYGLPQFRLRVFLWGSRPDEKLPQFPLPTHEVILRYGPPVEFERSVVGYDEGQPRQLEKELVLEDILSDLPVVTNSEARDQMPYDKEPQTEVQRFLRAPKFGPLTVISSLDDIPMLHDHRPLQLHEDDYLRVCHVPKRKGANFRDFAGVVVGADNVVGLDPTMKRVLLPSGKTLVPDYALNLSSGKSLRPFARLWWDETLSTVLTTPDCHTQVIIHPEQDRVLTIRECARSQGFPDCYQLCGTVKDRYRQVGNAVAVPVARALGYALAMAMTKQSGDDPLMTLPPKFPITNMPQQISSSSSEVQE